MSLGKHIPVDLKYADDATFINETSNLLQYVLNTSDIEDHRIRLTFYIKSTLNTVWKHSFQIRRHKTRGCLTQRSCGSLQFSSYGDLCGNTSMCPEGQSFGSTVPLLYLVLFYGTGAWPLNNTQAAMLLDGFHSRILGSSGE